MRRRLVPLLLGIVHCSATASPSLDGSYELTVAPPTPFKSSPVPLRLDLASNGGGYDVVLTAPFEDPVPATGSIQNGSLVVTLPTSQRLFTTPRPARRDAWSSLTIPVAAGALNGPAKLVGIEYSRSPDTENALPVTTTATVVRDGRAPAFALGGGTAGDTQFLPWDTFALRSDEPLAPSDVASSVRVVALGKDVTLTPRNTSWAGATTFAGALDPGSGGGSGTLTFTNALRDRQGNLAATTPLPFTILDVGAPTDHFDFDGSDSSQIGTWGATSLVNGGACDVGGCMQIGPFWTTVCGPPARLGIAGRLTKAGATKLVFRARATPPRTGPSNAEPRNALAVDVFDGATVTSKLVQREQLGDAWSTVTIPVTTTAIAFAIRANVESTCEPYPTGVDLTVRLDALHLE